MSNNEYQISKDRLASYKRNILLFGLLILVLQAVILFASPLFSEGRLISLITFVSVALVVGIALARSYASTSERLRKTRLMVSPQFIEKFDNESIKHIDYSDISKIQVHQTVDGKILTGVIYWNKSSIAISGYDKLDEIWSRIFQYVDNQSVIDQKTVKRFIPIEFFLILSLLVSSTLFFFITFLGWNAIILSSALLGLYTLIFQPFKRLIGDHFASKEIIMGCLLLLSAILMAIAQALWNVL